MSGAWRESQLVLGAKTRLISTAPSISKHVTVEVRMPSVELRWWNIAGGGLVKADAAIAMLDAWNAAIAVPPGAPAWAVAPAAIPVLGGSWSRALCEVNGNRIVACPGLGGGIAAVGASPTVPRWVAAKHRTGALPRAAQKGYYGNTAVGLAAPNRMNSASAGAWPNLQPAWGGYPAQLGVAPNRRDRALNTRVRGYAGRRELVYHDDQPLFIGFYHAISGGNSSTVYDLYEVLNLMTSHAATAAGPLYIVLLGDLNLDPLLVQNYFGGLLGGFAPAGMVGPGRELAIAANQYGVLHGGIPTHSSGTELDFAIVFHYRPGGGGAPIQAYIQCGDVVGGAIAPLAAVAGAFAGLPIPGGFQADHRPIKVQIDWPAPPQPQPLPQPQPMQPQIQLQPMILAQAAAPPAARKRAHSDDEDELASGKRKRESEEDDDDGEDEADLEDERVD
jgi:hypothetical protein